MAHDPAPLPFYFPCRFSHEGIPLGNGLLGVLLWASDGVFRFTLNRQDYWNHRGEIRWGNCASYLKALECLNAGNNARVIPELVGHVREGAPNPCRLPLGRVELDLGGVEPVSWLETATGIVRLNGKVPVVIDPDPKVCRVHILGVHERTRPVAPQAAEVRAYWKKYGIPEPVAWESSGVRGYWQDNAEDGAIAFAVGVCSDQTVIAVEIAPDARMACAACERSIREAPAFETVAEASRAFYSAWWERAPHVSISEKRIQIIYDYGMFKVAGMSRPGSPAPTLQGPWVEDEALPPWRCDYHFNINFQMIHWPLLPGNQLQQFEPAIATLTRWMPRMRETAELFAGIKDGIMLPHAVDDRCTPADTNWKCQFDVGGAAWVALQLWDLFRYGGDLSTLRELTFPMLIGTLRVYEALFELGANGTTLYAPSPEFQIAGRSPWFENPSFHLAIFHGLVRAVHAAANALGETESRLSRWQALASSIPPATLENGEIAIGRGVLLDVSHRHHSHLAGIYPFDTLDLDHEHSKIVQQSLLRWAGLGMGQWAGWSLPWAAIIWARQNEARAAGHILDAYERFFTGHNYFHSHNAFYRGFGAFLGLEPPYVMQLDGTAGAVTAIFEMLVHERNGRVHLAPAVPDSWGDVCFADILLPGGRTASGHRDNGKWHGLCVTEPRS